VGSPTGGVPASPPCLLARHRRGLSHRRGGLGQLEELSRQRLERHHLLEGCWALRHYSASVIDLRQLGQIKGHLLLRLVQPPLVRLTELRPIAVLKVLQALRHLFQPHDELGELVAAGIWARRGVALRVHRLHQ
jgi:hypothetical protein